MPTSWFQSDCNGEQNNIKIIILGLLGLKLREFVWLRVCSTSILVVSRGQTAFLAQGVIAYSILKRPHEKRVWSGLSGRVVLDTSVLSGGVDYIDVTFKRQAWSTFRRSYGVPVFFVSFTSELFVEPEEVKEIAWK